MEDYLSSPAAFLAAYPAFQTLGSSAWAMDLNAWQEFAQGLEPVDLQAGETLFACGDPRDAAFLILGGHILLTGATGYIGGRLLPLLVADGWRVVAGAAIGAVAGGTGGVILAQNRDQHLDLPPGTQVTLIVTSSRYRTQ